MAQVEQALYTIGVFQDVPWAARGIDALKKQGFGTDVMTVLARTTPEAMAFIEQALGSAPEQMELPVLGPTLARGSLLEALNGSARDLGRIGIAAAIRRAGFQPHDGLIYETLAARGGVLVAIADAPRAADALAVLQSYGGGNAAIGAWSGRV